MEPKKGKENELGTESVGKLLFRLSMPAIAAQVINVMYNMVDRMYIGHIQGVGAAALTGVGVTMPVIMAITAFAYFISMGGAPRSSIMLGRNEKEKAEKILGNCTTMLVVLALILTAVFLFCGRSILLLFGASENTIGYAWDYMKIYALGTIFVQLALGLNAFITAQGYAKTSMYTVLIGAVCNIILDPVFIFGLNMGVKGAALATILSQAVSSIGEELAAHQKEEPEAGGRHYSSLYGIGNIAVYHGVYGKHPVRLLQFIPASLRRRRGGRRHDDTEQCHAVFHASASGTDPGLPAHRQL